MTILNRNMKVILIEHHPKYDDYEEKVGIAADMETAEKYVDELRRQHPYAYNGRFSFEEFDLIGGLI